MKLNEAEIKLALKIKNLDIRLVRIDPNKTHVRFENKEGIIDLDYWDGIGYVLTPLSSFRKREISTVLLDSLQTVNKISDLIKQLEEMESYDSLREWEENKLRFNGPFSEKYI